MSEPEYTITRNRWRFGTFSWQGQAPQYDQLGEPGEIVYRRYSAGGSVTSTLGSLTWIDTLLYYDEQGYLAGILNYYPFGAVEHDGVELEKPGNVNMFVRPDVDDDKMVSRAMFTESQRRWNVRAETPIRATVGTDTFTTTGGAFLDGNQRIVRLSDLNK